jgi:DMSO reductase family type II enzyme chaperone
MPTPSEPALPGEWAARTNTPKRSVFGNYRATGATVSDSARSETKTQPARSKARALLQSSIDLAVARSFFHRFLAKAFEDPNPENWDWLCASDTRQSVSAASNACGISALAGSAFQPAQYQSFHDAYVATFGHAARGGCPPNEIEYGDIKADPLFQPHRLADLAAFYRAFELEVTEDAGERHDHICLELEFMCVLAAKEAYALEHQLDADQLAQCRDAQKKFLREHLGRWTPAFTRRLAAATNEPTLQALAEFTRTFIESECARFCLKPGSEELSLRPVDEIADRICDSCGINNLPPGALAAT